MGYIKSYGNYVIQKKHKLLKNGTIFERDYSTIGGVGNDFNENSKYYSHGTFVYQNNQEQISEKVFNKNNWEKNGENDYWTKESLGNVSETNNSLKISLKQDIYKLKDFAYYGSCSELIRSSINDIIDKFPGGLYVTSAKFTDKKGNPIKYGNSELYVIDNPFNIDIYSELNEITEENNNIKYLLPNYDNYIIRNTYNVNLSITKITKDSLLLEEEKEKCPPYFLYKIKLNSSFNIYCYMNDDNKIYYLTTSGNIGKHIRPKQSIYNNFINNLDNFQKILLNQESTPKYSAVFELMKESEDGYEIFFEKFTFPISKYGNYNLDITSEMYFNYINSLSYYGNFFDNLYTNNLYRQYTHESIKNFDWTDTLNRGEETKDEYVENGEKIQKIINLFGREFDEIKFYIDGIKNANNISYNDANNLPDYLLTDALNLDGWDVKNVFPFKKNTNYFNENINLIYNPYTNTITDCGSLIKSYFSGYWGEDCEQSKIIDNSTELKIDNKGFLREKIKPYSNEKSFNMQEMNNKFMKHLKLNSRHILQKKGTIDAIESLLSLFGLRSKKWYESLEKTSQERILKEMNFESSGCTPYDYEIIEYVTIAEHIEEVNNNNNYDLPITNNLYAFFNSTKDIDYSLNNTENPYQGLPVRYYEIIDKENNIKRLLYPYFSNEIDGQPYFQMNGGWVHKNYNISGSTVTNNDGGYIDTFTQISSIGHISELFKMNSDSLYDGIIFYVKNVKGDYFLIDSELYDIKYNEMYIPYINIEIIDNTLTIGNNNFYGEITTYDKNFNLINVNLGNLENHTFFKLFINKDGFTHLSQDDYILTNYQIINDGNLLNDEINNDLTNYYILRNKNWSNILSWGWERLKKSDKEYKTIGNLIKNNLANNPHANGLKYDNGINYVKYFHILFKYAIENNLIKQNCYQGVKQYLESLNEMEDNIGFKNIITYNDNDECYETINLYSDSKIHHFCNYFTSSGTIKNFCELIDANNNEYTLYDHIDYTSLKNDEKLMNSSGHTCLDQIINLKNIDIIFYYFNDDDKDEFGKYLNDIIVHYLSQILPSNIILNLKINKFEHK